MRTTALTLGCSILALSLSGGAASARALAPELSAAPLDEAAIYTTLFGPAAAGMPTGLELEGVLEDEGSYLGYSFDGDDADIELVWIGGSGGRLTQATDLAARPDSLSRGAPLVMGTALGWVETDAARLPFMGFYATDGDLTYLLPLTTTSDELVETIGFDGSEPFVDPLAAAISARDLPRSRASDAEVRSFLGSLAAETRSASPACRSRSLREGPATRDLETPDDVDIDCIDDCVESYID